MITNERQYRITRSALAQLRKSVECFDFEQAMIDTGENETLAQAQLDALESECEVLANQIIEYETLKQGSVNTFKADSLAELPLLLVKARIAIGLSQRQLADKLGLKEQQVQRYEAEKYASASLRRLVEISDCLGLKINESARLELESTKPHLSKALDLNLNKFPLNVMYRRAWFDNFKGSIREAETISKELLGNYLTILGPEPARVFHKKHVRAGSQLDEYSLMAWQCRILRLAQRANIRTQFKKSHITHAWLKGLTRLSAKDNGPQLAKDYLHSAGIALIVEPHLPQTYLDGAALLLAKEMPVIGMTLRFDRLDNFWFVLFHELGHLLLHLDKDNTEFFDDMDGSPDKIEKEADAFSCETLIPNDIWETSVARYLRNANTVNALAKQLEIGPALVAGRIRKESENYLLLSDFVGSGKARIQFPEVNFGT